jgi:hypothetical protein
MLWNASAGCSRDRLIKIELVIGEVGLQASHRGIDEFASNDQRPILAQPAAGASTVLLAPMTLGNM